MKCTPRKETDCSLALSFFLFKRNPRTHTHTSTQRMYSRLCQSRFMDRHWEMNTWNSHLTSSCFCGVSLCLPPGSSVWCEAAFSAGRGSLDAWLRSRTLQQAALLWRPGSQSGKHVFVSSNAVKTEKGRANSWGNRQWSPPPESRDLCAASRPDTQASSAKMNMHMYVIMLSCTKDFQLLRLHHAFQVVLSSVTHFSCSFNLNKLPW